MKTNPQLKEKSVKTTPYLQNTSESREKLANRDFEHHPRSKLGTVIAIVVAFLTFGGVAYSAIKLEYSGRVQLNIGVSGIQLQVDKEHEREGEFSPKD